MSTCYACGQPCTLFVCECPEDCTYEAALLVLEKAMLPRSLREERAQREIPHDSEGGKTCPNT